MSESQIGVNKLNRIQMLYVEYASSPRLHSLDRNALPVPINDIFGALLFNKLLLIFPPGKANLLGDWRSYNVSRNENF